MVIGYEESSRGLKSGQGPSVHCRGPSGVI